MVANRKRKSSGNCGEAVNFRAMQWMASEKRDLKRRIDDFLLDGRIWLRADSRESP